MKQAIEITTFNIRGCTFAAFIAANKAGIDPWLKKQKGFQSRYMIETADGTVMDMVLWDTEENGTDAVRRIVNETAGSEVHAMIDQRSVSWNMYPVEHSVDLHP